MTKHTVTTREQVMIGGIVNERVATHIVTGVHGYETLCTSGLSWEKDEAGNLTTDAVELSRNHYPVTCHVCKAVWQDVMGFKNGDFCTDDDFAKYEKTKFLTISVDENLSDYLSKHSKSGQVDEKAKALKNIDIDSYKGIKSLLASLLMFMFAYMIYSLFSQIYNVLPIGVGFTSYHAVFYSGLALMIGSLVIYISSVFDYLKPSKKVNSNSNEN